MTKGSLVCVLLVVLIGIIAGAILWTSDVARLWKHIMTLVIGVADIILIMRICAK
jgi:hypothetical protein